MNHSAGHRIATDLCWGVYFLGHYFVIWSLNVTRIIKLPILFHSNHSLFVDIVTTALWI